MNLHREKNRAVADSFKEFTEISRYIRVIIDIYSSSEITREYWLTEREKEFFVATVIHFNAGYINPISEESIQIYKEYFNPTTSKVKISDYLGRCRKKGWLKYNKRKKEVEIPAMFHDIGEGSDRIDFNLHYFYRNGQVNR